MDFRPTANPKKEFYVTFISELELETMVHLPVNEFKFRAWSQNQAERFIAHIPDLLVFDADFRKWSDSGTDVIVNLQVSASLDQLHTILDGMKDAVVIKRTIRPAPEFKPF